MGEFTPTVIHVPKDTSLSVRQDLLQAVKQDRVRAEILSGIMIVGGLGEALTEATRDMQVEPMQEYLDRMEKEQDDE